MTDDAALTIVRESAPGLPTGVLEQLTSALYFPLARSVAEAVADRKRACQSEKVEAKPLVVSVGGLPGTGKSTLVLVLARLLNRGWSLRAAQFSLDDLYLPSTSRAELARRVHPLFRQRGVPGTHDVAFGLALVRRLSEAGPDDVTPLPRFDKLADDPLPAARWPKFVGRPDLMLLDGWFWGAKPGDANELATPLNARERVEDAEGIWRRAVHRALGEGYPELFALSDLHIHLEAPSHAASVRWRVEQGREALRARGLDPGRLSPEAIARALDLFERVGRLPVAFERGYRVQLNEQHLVEEVSRVDPSRAG